MDSMEGYLRANDLELKYRIEAETFSGRKFSRVHFAHGLAEKPHVVERNIQLRGVRNGTEQCFVETAFVKVCLCLHFSSLCVFKSFGSCPSFLLLLLLLLLFRLDG